MKLSNWGPHEAYFIFNKVKLELLELSEVICGEGGEVDHISVNVIYEKVRNRSRESWRKKAKRKKWSWEKEKGVYRSHPKLRRRLASWLLLKGFLKLKWIKEKFKIVKAVNRVMPCIYSYFDNVIKFNKRKFTFRSRHWTRRLIEKSSNSKKGTWNEFIFTLLKKWEKKIYLLC